MTLAMADGCQHGSKKSRKVNIAKENISSFKLLIHDIWTNFKASLQSISCCKNRINLNTEIWPGLHELKKNIANMLVADFDLLCVLKTSDMERDIHELFHYCYKSKHSDGKKEALTKKFGYSFMKTYGNPRELALQI